MINEEVKDAASYCQSLAYDLGSKASHNKRESLTSFKLIMGLTVIAPILINFFEDPIMGKLVPSFMAALASFLTAWLNLRKPDSLWVLYRSSQRAIEKEIRLHYFDIAPYNESHTKDALLVENVTTIFSETHSNWKGLAPSRNDIVKEKTSEENK